MAKSPNASVPTKASSTLEAFIVATRPWSAPASLVPVAMAGAVARRHYQAELLDPNFVLCFVLVLSMHLAANLFNTCVAVSCASLVSRIADPEIRGRQVLRLQERRRQGQG